MQNDDGKNQCPLRQLRTVRPQPNSSTESSIYTQEFFPRIRTAAQNQWSAIRKSTFLLESRISNNFITVSFVIGRLPHVMIRTACYWFALWTLWRWWRVTKAMTSWWRRGQCEENWYSSSECSTHTQVRVNVQSHINMQEIHLTNIDRQKRWRDRTIL